MHSSDSINEALQVNEIVGDPVDATEKARLIASCLALAKAQFTADGFTEESGSLVVTIQDPAEYGNDPIVMLLDYTTGGENQQCRAPVQANSMILASPVTVEP